MNLHALAAGMVGQVNPLQSVTLRHSTGYTTNSDFTRTPTYSTSTINGQVQALSSAELAQVSALNLQGEKAAIYANGLIEGVSRPDNTGGDLLTLPDGSVWLVAIVLENWDRMTGWTKAAICRQSP